MWGVAVERLDVKHAKCLVDIVGGHRRPSGVTHEPGSFLVLMSMTITPRVFGVFGAPTSTTWCILYSTSLARVEATVSGRPVMFRDSAMSCTVRDQPGVLRKRERAVVTRIASGL
jgi:hypothetical protein